MREPKKKINVNKLYVLTSVAIIITICLMVLSLIFTVICFQNQQHFIFSVILTSVLFFIVIYEIVRFTSQLIYMDSFTLIGNATYVIEKAIFLSINKKLQDYCGLFINIKEFKYCNQRYGLENGDLLIQKYARYLSKYAKEHKGAAARLGGDNYFVLIHKDELENLLKCLKRVTIKIIVNGQEEEVVLKSYVGINNLNAKTEIRNIIFYASMALSEAKKTMRTSVVFENYMLENFTREKDLISDCNRALLNNEFIPYYQPKVDVKTGKLCGCEALVRWKKKDRIVLPGEFVPALEKAGIITKIDFRVFELVCIDIRNWLDEGVKVQRISTNFSKHHLKDPDFVKRIIEIKNMYKVDGKYLEIELTESAGVTDFSIIQDFAEQISAEGMHVSIDDFGTGYSSLSMLQNIKADVVKMDKSFLDASFNKEGEQFIIDVINIVKHQKDTILFEGVETKNQYEFLKTNGVDIIQGFYFDKPLSHDDFEKRLENPNYDI